MQTQLLLDGLYIENAPELSTPYQIEALHTGFSLERGFDSELGAGRT
jgi:hypothetical protein